jgi:hypothetical protein
MTAAAADTKKIKRGPTTTGFGTTPPGKGWKIDKNNLLRIDVDTSSAGFKTTPAYIVSVNGDAWLRFVRGSSTPYEPTPTGFYLKLQYVPGDTTTGLPPLTTATAAKHKWHVAWMGIAEGEELAPFVPPTGPTGLYVKHSNKALDVSGGSGDNGATIEQWDWKNADHQKFRFEAVGDGYYRIVAKHSNKAVAMSNSNVDNGIGVNQLDYQDRDYFKFSFEPVGYGYFRINVKHSGKALCVANASQDNGARVEQWDYQDADNFKWRL